MSDVLSRKLTMGLKKTNVTLLCEGCGARFPSAIVHDGRWKRVPRLVACDTCRKVGPHSVVAVGPTTDVVLGWLSPTAHTPQAVATGR